MIDYLEDAEKADLVLAIFDIDDFKMINDTYGHVTGDYILKKVAQIVSEFLDDSFVCRFGGEEFVAVLKDSEEKPFVERLEELRKLIEKEVFEFENVQVHITTTIGAVKYIKDITIEKWLEFADRKMYAGKNSGKNKTVY